MSRVPAIPANVLDFLHASRLRAESGSVFTLPSTPPPAVDRQAAANVITMPRRAAVFVDPKPSVNVLAKVTESVDKLFPRLRGSMREEMIASIGNQIAEDPRASKLIA